jgi:chromosome partitioning protein
VIGTRAVAKGLGWPSGAADAQRSDAPSPLGWPGALPEMPVSRETETPTALTSGFDTTEAAGSVPHPATTSSESSLARPLATGDDESARSEESAPQSVSRETELASPVVSRETEPGPEREDMYGDTPIADAVEKATRMRERARLGTLPRPPETRILTVANQKGGVGKTTSTVNLAAALALHGLQVLVLDLDPQGNASTAFGIDHHADVPSVYDVLVDGKALADVILPVEAVDNLFCAPATIDLAGAEIELVSLVARESRLQRALTALQRERAAAGEQPFDYVLIDCPPSLGLLTVNALVAAREVLIPIQCEYYALEGLTQLLRNVDLVRAHLNPDLRVSTILLTMYDGRTRLAAQVADDVRKHFSDIVLGTTIPRSVRISEAPSYGQTVMTYDPGSSGALSYLEAARELGGARKMEENR